MLRSFSKKSLASSSLTLTIIALSAPAWSIAGDQSESDITGTVLKTQKVNEYFTKKTVQLSTGNIINMMSISGPPTPPEGVNEEETQVDLSQIMASSSATLLEVPAFTWVFGCSSVSAAMIAGYYDRNGFSNIYTGPTNGGVMPLNNSTTYWETWTDSTGANYPNLPLAASQNGVDGRTTNGSIDDYWVSYNSSEDDPYISGSWSAHSNDGAVGDYMKTSQSAYGNVDGGTSFYSFTDGTPLSCSDMESYGIEDVDGTYGRKLFYEARGYTVTDCYSQYTDNVSGAESNGFTYDQYKDEIDAGRPVMVQLQGHTVVGVGYDDASGETIYIHDTWDNSEHEMTWGGSYSGMSMYAVSIVNISDDSSSDTDTDSDFPWSIYLPVIESGRSN